MEAIITVGIPGSGKSHFAKTCVGYEEINLDDIRKKICGNENNQEVTQHAVEIQDGLIDMCIEDKKDIIVSNTHLNTLHLVPLVEKLQHNGYIVTGVIFNVDFSICIERNANRKRVVPMYAMLRMQSQMQTMITILENTYNPFNKTIYMNYR